MHTTITNHNRRVYNKRIICSLWLLNATLMTILLTMAIIADITLVK